jgi:nucleotide-binding universal stress UspA family protein
MLRGRGVVVLVSDLLDPAADRVIRELASTGSELIVLHVLSPDELDPALEGDLKLVDSETGEGIDVTIDLATLDDYRARLAAWQASFADLAAKRRASYVPLSTDVPLADLVFAELRRRRVVG